MFVKQGTQRAVLRLNAELHRVAIEAYLQADIGVVCQLIPGGTLILVFSINQGVKLLHCI